MTIIVDKNLRDFDFWSGGLSNAMELSYEQFEKVEDILEDMYPNGMTDTEINDLFWFEFDRIKEWLDIKD